MFRPYQEIIFQHQLANERCNVWSFMGSGKTLSTLTLLDYLYGCGFESKPTLVIAPLRVARSVWPAEAKKWKHLSLEVSAIVGTEAERLRALKRDVPIYSINYENIPWLTNVLRGKWPFSGVIADECFTAGTMVSTPSGPRAIESLSVGDEVLSHLGPKKIAKRFTRAAYPFKLVSLKLSNGETIHATENHPFFTELGWLPARACRGRRLFSSDDLSVLWQGICQERKCGALQSQAWDPAILLTQLPHIAHVSASAGDAQKRVGDDGENTKNNGYILEQRSSMVEGATEFDVASSQSSGPIANGEGREWQGNVSERGFDLPLSTQGLYLELRSVVGEEGTWVSQQLQSGLWQPCEANIFGDRWQLPHYQSGQGTGREERPETTVIGVARYSDLKQRSMETTYDLEIEDAHT